MRNEAISKLIREGTPVTEKNIQLVLSSNFGNNRAIDKILSESYLNNFSLNEIYNFIIKNYANIVSLIKSMEDEHEEVSESIANRSDFIGRRINDVYNEIASAQVLESKMSGYLKTINLDFSSKAVVDQDSTVSISDNVIFGIPNKAELNTEIEAVGKGYTLDNVDAYIRGSNVPESSAASIFLIDRNNTPIIPTQEDRIINSDTAVKIEGRSSISGSRQLDIIIDKEDNEIFNQINFSVGKAHLVDIYISTDGKDFIKLFNRPKYVKDTPLMVGTKNHRYIKITFYKDDFDRVDNGEYVYEIKFKKFEIVRTVLSNETLFLSNSIEVPGIYSKLAIDTCDNYKNSGVEIQYELNVDDKGWDLIRPVNKLSSKDKVISPSVYSINEYTDNKIIVLKDNEVDINGDILYNLELPSEFLTSNQIKIFADELSEEDNSWKQESIFYTVYGILKNPVTIDFGQEAISINGKWVSDEVQLTKGVYIIKVRKENYINIVNLFSSSITKSNKGEFDVKDSEGNIVKVYDPLWPYNHKLLIEENFDFLFREELFEKIDYTIYNSDSNFKISTNKEYKEILIIYKLYQSEMSKVKIRAKLKSLDNTTIPYIEKIMLRLV